MGRNLRRPLLAVKLGIVKPRECRQDGDAEEKGHKGEALSTTDFMIPSPGLSLPTHVVGAGELASSFMWRPSEAASVMWVGTMH